MRHILSVLGNVAAQRRNIRKFSINRGRIDFDFLKGGLISTGHGGQIKSAKPASDRRDRAILGS